MNKNVIALAVAAAMAAPLAAQAEVTVSGGLQAEIVSMSGDTVAEGLTLNDAQQGGTIDRGNFGALNFSASEDLGNGLKAIAKYSFNVSTADRASNIGVRDGYVGLSGNFGTVMAGRMSTPYKMSTVKWDPFLATSAQARGNYGLNASLHGSEVDNVIAYANKFGMAKVAIGYVLDESLDAAGDRNGKNDISASLNMPVGPIEVAIGYQNDDGASASAAKVGVKYTAGAIGASVTFESLEAGIGGVTVDTTHMLLNVTYSVGANTFALGLGQQDNNGANTPTYMAVGMVHSFSKSTSAHVGYIGLDNDAGATNSGIAAGLRVAF